MPGQVGRASGGGSAPDELPLVQVDAVLIEQALGQILDNAWEVLRARILGSRSMDGWIRTRSSFR